MKMNGDIRVRISKEHELVYNTVTKGIGVDSHVLFFMGFCIAIAKKLEPISIKSRVDRFWSKTFEPQEWTSMYSVILDKNEVNLKAIENDEDVIREVEMYANAGICDFLNNIPQEYIRKSGGVVSLAIDDKGEAIKDILYLLLETYLTQEEEQ